MGIDGYIRVDGDYSAESGLRCVEQLLGNSTDVTAIFAMNDVMAFGARLALHRGGVRVPDDISLIGFDDQMETAFATPPISTVRQPAREMGESAANAVLAMISGESTTPRGLRAELIERESVRQL